MLTFRHASGNPASMCRRQLRLPPVACVRHSLWGYLTMATYSKKGESKKGDDLTEAVRAALDDTPAGYTPDDFAPKHVALKNGAPRNGARNGAPRNVAPRNLAHEILEPEIMPIRNAGRA